MTDLPRVDGDIGVNWDASSWLASLPFSFRQVVRLALAVLLLLCLAPSAALLGQGPAPRPWLAWRTVETEHFVLHYPTAYREWTLSLAERIEAIRTKVADVVGYAPPGRVHIIVDDPVNDVNGYAVTPLDEPTIVLWPVSPNPREDVGDYVVWQELLAIHEFAHVAHLTRPSRNRWQRFLRSLSPVPLGPIATKAPRWLIEGYATFVEGRLTGSGRPNHAWRAAVLRQFALEGRLPSYGQLSSTGGWRGGSFAYLAGSAFLEWLARREGDSSVVALSRRLSAKTDRSFDAAFSGLYGGSPAELYGRFTAELTADAVEIGRELRKQRLAQGAIVQRLARSTGDPAISPDGRFVALTVRTVDAPSALVVWKTAEDPDSLATLRRASQRRRDPDDVPDRAFYPAPRKVIATLIANDGAAYEAPRWFADNRRLLVYRNVTSSDGTIRPDLFSWSAEDGRLERLTRGAALRDADPSPDGRWAAAVRCAEGWCDLVRVDLTTKAIRMLRAGSVERNYYRPRISHRTGEIVVAEQLGNRWRVARVSAETGELRYADPDDGANRYDAAFDLDGSSIIATSERNGFINLERLDPSSGEAVPITRVTGAAVAADVAPDGAIWFLNFHASGFDLRRLVPDSTRIFSPLPTVVHGDTASSVLPPTRAAGADSTSRLARSPRPEERRYGPGPSRLRYLPGVSVGFGGSTATLAIIRSDPVGRLGVSALGAVGSAALPAGGALTITSRLRRTVVGTSGWISHEAPSRLLASALDAGLDLTRFGGVLRVDRSHANDGSDLLTTVAIVAERQRATSLSEATRSAGVVSATGTLRQFDEGVRYLVQVNGMAEFGTTATGRYARQRTGLLFGAARGNQPLVTARFTYGRIDGADSSGRERFVVGGFRSPLIDPLFDARRVEAPAYPIASATGDSFIAYRFAMPVRPVEIFYSGVSTDVFRDQLRSYGAEYRQRVPRVSALGTPEVDLVAGLVRARDVPVRGQWRVYTSFALRP